MHESLSQPGTLILDPEKPGPIPALPVCVSSEGTVPAESWRGRTLPPSIQTGQGTVPSPSRWYRGPQAGPGRIGLSAFHPSQVCPVWEFAMISLWVKGKLHCPLPWFCSLPTTGLFPWTPLSSPTLPLQPGIKPITLSS